MLFAVIPVLLAVVAVWLGRRMATALLILAYLSIEGFLKMLSNYNAVVHVGLDIIVIALATVLVLQAVVQQRAHLDELPYTRLILVYCVWMVLQLLNPFSPGLIQSIASFKVHLTMVPLYFIAAGLFHEPRDVAKFIFGLTVIMLLPYAMALAQYALGPSSVLDLSPRYWMNISYYHDWRPFGTSAVPGGTSVYAFLITPLTLVLLVAPGMRNGMKPIAVLAIALAMGVFVVSGIRQVFLGCVLTILMMATLLMSRRRSRIAAVGALAIAVGAGAYVGVQTFLRPMATEAILRDPRSPDIWRQRDVTTRLLTLTSGQTYREARANPVSVILYRARHYPFGAGMGRTGSAAGAFQRQLSSATNSRVQADVGWTADNFWADMIVEGGLPAAIMLTWILVGMMRGGWRLARDAEDPVIIATAAALTGFYFSVLVMSWGSQPLLGNPITAYFWFLSGMLVAMRRMDDRRRQEEQDADEAEDSDEVALAPATAR